jgi:DNA ligase-1
MRCGADEPGGMTLDALVATSHQITATSSKSAKIARLSAFLRDLAADEIEIGVAFLTGQPRQGKIGAGYALLSEVRQGSSARAASLTLTDVDRAFAAFSEAAGRGSAARRADVLGRLFAQALRSEQEFLARLIIGELRQGALAGIMVEAIAAASGIPQSEVRRAAMHAELGTVARAAITEGAGALARFQLVTLQPAAPMLAQSADDIVDALARIAEPAIEWKLDGARIQVHKADDDVRVFTRNLNDVTVAVPEVVEIVRDLPARELVLDGEAIALDRQGSPRPFQMTMRRFGRKLDVESLRTELPLSPFFFDILRHDGDVLTHRPARDRFAALDEALPVSLVVPRIVTTSRIEAEAFVRQALARGHEGVMAKALDAPYEAGRRGAAWLKVKVARTLDLVVLAAEWGHGRRRGWLSNLHLGARDPASGGFVMLGKTFKGMTDKMLEWQTRAFLEREIARDEWTVYVKPEIVVEVAFNEVQASPQYPGGVALRFARVKQYRPDKPASETDTIDTVRSLKYS